MQLMENYDIFDEDTLARIGVVCPACNTEVIFDLSKDQTAHDTRPCPGCKSELLPTFRRGDHSYNVVTWYKIMRDRSEKPKGAPSVRLYFKKA